MEDKIKTYVRLLGSPGELQDAELYQACSLLDTAIALAKFLHRTSAGVETHAEGQRLGHLGKRVLIRRHAILAASFRLYRAHRVPTAQHRLLTTMLHAAIRFE